VPTRFQERLELEVLSKRLSRNPDEAVIERRVTYNYSEKVELCVIVCGVCGVCSCCVC